MAFNKRRRDDDGNDGGEYVPPAGGNSQVLPVADLPADFDGEATDGATYLALASRENEKRPFVTRVDPPAAALPARPAAAPAKTRTGQRHPVLPRESWVVVFSAHFAAYKASLGKRWEAAASGPVSKPHSAPVPEHAVAVDAVDEEEAMNGGGGGGDGGEAAGGNKEKEVDGQGTAKQQPSEVDLPAAYDYDGWIGYVDGVPEEMDEEEAMNAEYTPREPLVSVLRRLDTHTILAILSHLTPSTSLPPHRAKWLFALLSILDPQLGSDDLSALRSFARDMCAFIETRYLRALESGQLVAVPVYPGFYAGDASADPIATLSRDPLAPQQPHGWTLGAQWKRDMGARPRSEAMRPDSDSGSVGVPDDEIARAWVVVFAVVAGWAQRDLVEEFERALGKLPLPP